MVNAVTFIVIANIMGPADYGVFAYALTVATFAPLCAGLGGDHVLIMRGSRKPVELPALLGNALAVRGALSAAVFGALAVGLDWVGAGSMAVLLTTTAGTLVGAFAFPLLASYYRVLGETRRPWMFLTVGPAVMLLLLVVAHGAVRTPLAVATLYLGSQLVGVVLFVADVARRAGVRVDGALARRDARLGLTFTATQVLDLVFQRADILVLQVLAGSAAVGIYNAGYRFAATLIALPTAMHVVLLPEFHRAGSDPERLAAYFTRIRRLLLEVGLLVLGALAVASLPITLLLLGSQFAAAAPVIAVSAVATLVTFVSFPYSMLAEAMGHVRERLAFRAVALACGVLTSVIAIPRLAGTGAALGATVGAAAFLVLLHLRTCAGVEAGRDTVAQSAPVLPAALALALAIAAARWLGAGAWAWLNASVVFVVCYLMIGTTTGTLRWLTPRELKAWRRRLGGA